MGSKFSLLLLLILPLRLGAADNISTGIYAGSKIYSVWLAVSGGEYTLSADSLHSGRFSPGDAGLHIALENNKVVVKYGNQVLASCDTFTFNGTGSYNSFKVKPLKTELTERIFDGNLRITVRNNSLLLINDVNLDHYVAGVVESENGIRQNFEYYKLKSIICRTYALSNLHRHLEEGFSVCDKVHCQVYHGKNNLNDDILMAAVATSGKVIVDSSGNLITAAFHSNCGGHTLNSEDVWPGRASYLRGVPDTFCLDQPHARWEAVIPEEEWIGYIRDNHLIADSLEKDCAVYYHPDHRENTFSTEYFSIPLRDVRQRFNLRSTWFWIDPRQQGLLIRGRGYGHGIGLCQEGAMKMADSGFKYHEILHYYYNNIRVTDLSSMAP